MPLRRFPVKVALILSAATLSHSPTGRAIAASKVVYNQTQSTFDGLPFMPRGIYGVNIPDMDRADSYGFNIVQTYQMPGMSDDEVENYLNEAEKRGLKVFFSLSVDKPDPENIAKTKRRVLRFKAHPALYAWYLVDEPTIAKIKPTELEPVYRWIKANDEGHPVFTSNWELHNFRNSTDVDMPQFYSGAPSGLRMGNLPKQKLITAKYKGLPWLGIANAHDDYQFRAYNPYGSEILSPSVIRSLDLAAQKKTDGAGVEISEAAQAKIRDIQDNLANPPYKAVGAFPDTPTKIRGQAWDFIAHGSNGIFYWLLQPENTIDAKWGYYTIFTRPALRDELKKTLSEMQTLWPRVTNPASASTTWYESQFGNVFYWHRQQEKEITVIAINESEADWHTVETALPNLKNIQELTAVVSGENRVVTVQNGLLKDTFRSNEAHVYLITLK